jgi:glycosyltransferase involved in cell wall biosynthesis
MEVPAEEPHALDGRPLRFCFLTTFYPPANFGGDGIQVQRLAHALAERGHSVTVVHSAEAFRTLAHGPPSVAAAEIRGITVLPIDSGVGWISPLATYLSGRPLFARPRLENVLREGFDVLHFHNPSLLGGPSLLKMGSGIKLYTAHEQWLLCPSHTLWKHKRRICESPPCWSCTFSYGRPPQLWRYTGLLEASLAHLDALIVPSRTSAELHERFSSVVPLAHIPHFVPDPGAAGSVPRSERPFFLFVGRLESIKGVSTLLRVFRRQRAVDLAIAGTGSLARALQDEAADLPHIHFLGWRSESELDRHYRDALAVIVPTVGHEAFGLVPVEGFARATPAIVRDFGALRELIVDSGGGLAFGSERELEDSVAAIAADSDLRQTLGQHGREGYERLWTQHAHLMRYFSLIADVAETRGDAALAGAARAAASREGTGAR